MAITAAQDVGGFGRLAEMKFKKRAEEREERRLSLAEQAAAKSAELTGLQIKQTEANLQKIQRQAVLKDGLSKAMSNIPEGENQYTTGYNYFMSQGAVDEAQKYANAQSLKIDQLYKIDPEAATKLFNDTIGRTQGTTAEYVKEDPVQGDILKIRDKRTGKITYGSRTKAGKFIPLPDYVEPIEDPTKRTKTVSDLELEDEVTKRFVKEQGLSPVDARLRAQSFIAENKRGKGISIKTDKEGNQVISIGGKAQTGEITKKTRGAVEADILESNATYADMKAIVGKVEDKFLEMPTRIGAAWTSLKEKWKVGEVSDEDRQELAEYTDFRRESISSLNAYIKQITGAAMSELEAKRLMKAMPTPGMGLFDGDSPTEFRTKLKGVMKSLDRVTARNNYVAKYGLTSFEEIPLDQMDGIIRRRGDTIYRELKATWKDMSEAELKKRTKKELSEEFGLRF